MISPVQFDYGMVHLRCLRPQSLIQSSRSPIRQLNRPLKSELEVIEAQHGERTVWQVREQRAAVIDRCIPRIAHGSGTNACRETWPDQMWLT